MRESERVELEATTDLRVAEAQRAGEYGPIVAVAFGAPPTFAPGSMRLSAVPAGTSS